MKMKQRILFSLLFGLAMSILGGLSGMLACKVVLKIGYDVVLWDTHIQGNPPLADTPEGHSGQRETFFGKTVSERRAWMWSTKPDESYGVQDFKTMIFDICVFAGRFTGTLIGVVYLLAQVGIGLFQNRYNQRNLLTSSLNPGSTSSPESLPL